jgi:hypothetical protein
MAYLMRTANGEIKTYMETSAGNVLEPGETLEEIALSFAAFSHLLRLAVDGHSGELVQISTGSGSVVVDVDCPGEAQVALNINGLEETIPLMDGKGALTLSSAVPGTFVIAPADRTKYYAAGEALCIVEISE